jgi:Holliday junction resolvase RusA-like endonuclease
VNRAPGWSVEFDIRIHPVPAPRMTQRSLWAPEVKAYLDFKDQLRDLIKVKLRQELLDIPPVQDKTARRKFGDAQRKAGVRYQLQLQVQIRKDIGDLDNYFKGVKDAIQAAGLVFNDKQIKRYTESEVFVEPHLDEGIWFKLVLLEPYRAQARGE